MAKVEALVKDLENSVHQLKAEVSILGQFEQLFFKFLSCYLNNLSRSLTDGKFSVVNRVGTAVLGPKYENSFLIIFKLMKKRPSESFAGVSIHDENHNLLDKTSSMRVALVNLSKKESEIYDVFDIPGGVRTEVKLIESLLTDLGLYDPPHQKSY